MNSGYSKIGVAIAFSPTALALLSESARLVQLLNAQLVVIHVGEQGNDQESMMQQLIQSAGLDPDRTKVVWEKGDPSKCILKVSQSEKLDMLIVGALKKERMVNYYIGSIARKIMRKARCSVLVICRPSEHPTPFKNIVVNAEDSPFVLDAVRTACWIAQQDKSHWVHVVRELKMLGLTLSAANQYTEQEYNQVKQKLIQEEINQVDQFLEQVPNKSIKVNVKVIAGKSGFELSKFARRKQAELLIVGAPARRFFWVDRIFPHDQEYLFADLPCNLLIVQPQKG